MQLFGPKYERNKRPPSPEHQPRGSGAKAKSPSDGDRHNLPVPKRIATFVPKFEQNMP